MFVTFLKCDGCGLEGVRLGEYTGRGQAEENVERRRWLVQNKDWPARHYCPTCRRAVEAAAVHDRKAAVEVFAAAVARATVKEQA
jgi:hypothetical protein